ncbi:hypothetical protein KFL_004950050 [Klebsormidium nitens]|uniref:Pseudouridine-5'-phosphate glycosidase n=1 Tax=Klebsormidium nitens TaxID=105231 RepID=A0A1Y1IK99_KLENI|nr:hypothetical protein KFL_004950050 [Klebsormidium nitens]|eukprot:GAQ89186.1 hypothetical protein KFL_004950050 [Klebsormidium nitens]
MAVSAQIAMEACNGSAYQVSDPVKRALEAGSPVVALESTIVCHGMPFPQNLKTAREVEDIVRANGAEPATIAIIRGVVHVGLTGAELEDLARRGLSVKKTARRDIAYVVSQKKDGATTVSATMFFAAKVGIPVFVTGGIGGVHRGAESSMDISSDLTELGRTPVAVVCAGVKSILDIPRTLEYLETQGVTVAALGTDEFPAFFTPHSGCKAPSRVNSEMECAELIDANVRLGLGSGIVIGVPIPESDAAASEKVEAAIQRALSEASGKISGADSTPFLLKRVNELSGGASLQANVALVKNNAKIGAQIAWHLATIHRAKTTQLSRL